MDAPVCKIRLAINTKHDFQITSLWDPNSIGVRVHSPLGGAAADPKTVLRNNFGNKSYKIETVEIIFVVSDTQNMRR